MIPALIFSLLTVALALLYAAYRDRRDAMREEQRERVDRMLGRTGYLQRNER